MKKIIPLILLYALSIPLLNAQTIVYQKTFGGAGNDFGFSGIYTADGSFAFVGHSRSFSGSDNDIVLLKLDSIHNLQWTKRFGGSGNDEALKVIQCSDGGFAICGMTQSYGSGGYDALLIKTDSTGAVQFLKTYGGLTDDRFLNLRQTSDSGFILAGSTTNFGFGNWDMLYVKTNANGDTLWTKIIGNMDYDQGTDAIETNDGGFFFTGRAASWGAGYSDIFMAKANSSGDTLWTRSYGTGGFDEGMKVKQSFDNGFIITGATNGMPTGGYEVFLNKVDSAGNLMWSRVYGGLYTEASYDVIQLEDSGYAVVGITESFGSNHLKNGIKNGEEPSYYDIPGKNNKLMGNDNTNIFLIRTDVNGDTIWSYAYGGNLQEEGYAIAAAPDHGFVTSGYSMSFNSDSIDFYVVKTDSNGFSNCYEEYAYPVVDTPATIVSATTALLNSGLTVTDVTSILLNAFPFNTLIECYTVLTSVNDFQHEAELFNLYPNPCSNFFTLSHDKLSSDKYELEIYDVTGRNVKHLHLIDDPATIIQVGDLPAGMYCVNIINKKQGLQYLKTFIKGN